MAGTVVISISLPDLPAYLKEGWEDILRLEFHDAIRPHPVDQGLVLFSQNHVEAVHAFVAEYIDKDFIVHCDAGRSRSVAVAERGTRS